MQMCASRRKATEQPCQGWGRGFESLRPLQISSVRPGHLGNRPYVRRGWQPHGKRRCRGTDTGAFAQTPAFAPLRPISRKRRGTETDQPDPRRVAPADSRGRLFWLPSGKNDAVVGPELQNFCLSTLGALFFGFKILPLRGNALVGCTLHRHQLHLSQMYGLRRDQACRIFLENN